MGKAHSLPCSGCVQELQNKTESVRKQWEISDQEKEQQLAQETLARERLQSQYEELYYKNVHQNEEVNRLEEELREKVCFIVAELKIAGNQQKLRITCLCTSHECLYTKEMVHKMAPRAQQLAGPNRCLVELTILLEGWTVQEPNQFASINMLQLGDIWDFVSL